MLELVSGKQSERIRRIVQIEAEAFGCGGLNEWTLMPLVRHGRVYCLLHNGEVVGSAQFQRDWENPRLAYLFGVSVAKHFRGRGLGTELLQKSFRNLARERIEEVELTVAPDNTVALEVYRRKLGFAIIGYQENEYGEGEHRYVMRLSLKDW